MHRERWMRTRAQKCTHAHNRDSMTNTEITKFRHNNEILDNIKKPKDNN